MALSTSLLLTPSQKRTRNDMDRTPETIRLEKAVDEAAKRERATLKGDVPAPALGSSLQLEAAIPPLLRLPNAVLSIALTHLSTSDLARAACASKELHAVAEPALSSLRPFPVQLIEMIGGPGAFTSLPSIDLGAVTWMHVEDELFDVFTMFSTLHTASQHINAFTRALASCDTPTKKMECIREHTPLIRSFFDAERYPDLVDAFPGCEEALDELIAADETTYESILTATCTALQKATEKRSTFPSPRVDAPYFRGKITVNSVPYRFVCMGITTEYRAFSGYAEAEEVPPPERKNDLICILYDLSSQDTPIVFSTSSRVERFHFVEDEISYSPTAKKPHDIFLEIAESTTPIHYGYCPPNQMGTAEDLFISLGWDT